MRRSCIGFAFAISGSVAGFLSCLLWLHERNSRVLASWHGFLHSAIATRFPSPTWVPENPFFAGEPLPYYWAYHYLGSHVASLFATDQLHAFHLISLSALVVLLVAAGLIGRLCFRSTTAALLVGYFALVGFNPLGPLIAFAKHLVKGTSLISDFAGGATNGSIFVSNQLADDRMTQPLLGAMHVGSDWRHGQNLVWFLDISGRALALTAVMIVAFLILSKGSLGTRSIGIALVAAFMTAMDPLIGLAVTGTLVAAQVVVFVLASQRRRDASPLTSLGALCGPSLACMAGCALALPTYHHILLFNEGNLRLSQLSFIPLRSVAVVLNCGALCLFAFMGVRRASFRAQESLWVIAIAGLMLLAVVPFVHLNMGVEHDFSNAGQCLLAIPAAAWFVDREWAPPRTRFKRPALLSVAFIAFLPTTVSTLYAYDGTPALPIGFERGVLRRLPRESPLDRFYVWVREHTPREAVFISDPRKPVKMSGNVAEFPAFTGRSLFIDHDSYLTVPYPDVELRKRLAVTAVEGASLADYQLTYLRDLGRPLYVVNYHADRDGLVAQLGARYGAARFRHGFVAVFELEVP
jgi:hypothetical protein